MYGILLSLDHLYQHLTSISYTILWVIRDAKNRTHTPKVHWNISILSNVPHPQVGGGGAMARLSKKQSFYSTSLSRDSHHDVK